MGFTFAHVFAPADFFTRLRTSTFCAIISSLYFLCSYLVGTKMGSILVLYVLRSWAHIPGSQLSELGIRPRLFPLAFCALDLYFTFGRSTWRLHFASTFGTRMSTRRIFFSLLWKCSSKHDNNQPSIFHMWADCQPTMLSPCHSHFKNCRQTLLTRQNATKAHNNERIWWNLLQF